ncbi:MAG: zinc metalloprotease HtpX [Planctomycetota bacterium]
MTAFTNNLKTVALLGALFALVVWVGSFWGTGGMLFAGVIAIVMNFGAWFASDRIAITAMRGIEIDEHKLPHVYDMVRRLSQRAGLPMPRVYICPHKAPNAFATGRSPKKSAVAITEGLLQILDHEELEGVIAHELAHIKNRDTLTSTIAATVAGLFAMMAQMSFYMFGFSRGNRGGNPLVLIGVVTIGAVGAAMIKAMISRSREYVADADGAQIAGSPRGLASALQKLESMSKRIPLQQPNPAMNNMFIVEPFMGKAMTNLFASHPPTQKRIAALMNP